MCAQPGLWGNETSSGNIPLPRLSHGGETEKKKTRSFYAVNFAAPQTGLRSECGAARKTRNTNANSPLTARHEDYGSALGCWPS